MLDEMQSSLLLKGDSKVSSIGPPLGFTESRHNSRRRRILELNDIYSLGERRGGGQSTVTLN